MLWKQAERLSDLPESQFDTVILNSVVQYFPSADYLLEVLEGALRILAPGGTIFIGDVRNLQLLEAFHLSVQLWRANAEMDAEELRKRVRQAVRSETELLVDPKLFLTLRERTLVSEVDIELKRGATESEMTRFRYDVILRTGDRSNRGSEFQLDGPVPLE